MMSLTELVCKIDDFCQEFESVWNQQLLDDGSRNGIGQAL